MYHVNFKQQSNVENFTQRFVLYATDDNTNIQNSQVIVEIQMWARSARGTGDQSQFFGNWPFIYGGGYNAVPAFTATTTDGTGMLTLNDGILDLNIPFGVIQRLLPGYYEIGMTLMTPDRQTIVQLAVGTVPFYNGGVWNYPPFYTA